MGETGEDLARLKNVSLREMDEIRALAELAEKAIADGFWPND
jgi:hypothetical protein